MSTARARSAGASRSSPPREVVSPALTPTTAAARPKRPSCGSRGTATPAERSPPPSNRHASPPPTGADGRPALTSNGTSGRWKDAADKATGVSSVVVAVRVRPISSVAASAGHQPGLRSGATSVTLSPGKSETRFGFDLVFGEDATQEAVYEEVGAPILRKALQGFNATIFAYGQTGSGKTHTMMGDVDAPGVIPRMASELFFCVDKALAAAPDRKFLLTCSYLEIYNEVLHDLLQPAPRHGEKRVALEVGEHPSLGVHVKGLLERPVRSEHDIISLLAAGSHRRATAATLMNERSSRSHSIFVVRMQQQEQVAGNAAQKRETWSRINLVDLAGSERMGKTGAAGVQARARAPRSTPASLSLAHHITCHVHATPPFSLLLSLLLTPHLRRADEGGHQHQPIPLGARLGDHRARPPLGGCAPPSQWFTPSLPHPFFKVIIALADSARRNRPTFVPYRNSKLTRVLQARARAPRNQPWVPPHTSPAT